MGVRWTETWRCWSRRALQLCLLFCLLLQPRATKPRPAVVAVLSGFDEAAEAAQSGGGPRVCGVRVCGSASLRVCVWSKVAVHRERPSAYLIILRLGLGRPMARSTQVTGSGQAPGPTAARRRRRAKKVAQALAPTQVIGK